MTLTALLLLAGLPSCAGMRSDSICLLPAIEPDKADVLADRTVRAILIFQEAQARFCK